VVGGLREECKNKWYHAGSSNAVLSKDVSSKDVSSKDVLSKSEN
jgi:hypothetical protein